MEVFKVQPSGQSLTFGKCCCCCCCCCIRGTLEGLAFVFWYPVLGTASQTLQASPAVDQMGNSLPTADRLTWISFETEIFTEDT